MIGNYTQDQQQQLVNQKQQNPLVFSARGQVNILMEEINEADKYFQSRQIKQQIKIAVAMNDAQTLNQLLESSEIHNQKLRDLIEIIKVNHTNEINRNYQLQVATDNLQKSLNERQALVQHLENSLSDHRQRECGYIERIAELEEKLNLIQQQNQQLNSTNHMLMNMPNHQSNHLSFQKQNSSNIVAQSNRQQLMSVDGQINQNSLSNGYTSGLQSNLNCAAETPFATYTNLSVNKGSIDTRQNSNININYFPTINSNNNNGTIQNNLNPSLTPHNQQIIQNNNTNQNNKQDNNDSQNILSIDSQTHLSTWNKTQFINQGSSTQVITLAGDSDQLINDRLPKKNQSSNFSNNINRGQSFISPTSAQSNMQPLQQQHQHSLSNSNILSNSRIMNQNQLQNVQNFNQINDISNQSLNSTAYKKKIEQVIQKDNESQGQGLNSTLVGKESVRTSTFGNNQNHLANVLQYNSQQSQPLAINTNTINQQTLPQGSLPTSMNSQRQNQKPIKSQPEKGRQQPLSNRFKENSSSSKTPKKQSNAPNYQSQVCTISLKQQEQQVDQTTQHTNNNNNSSLNSNHSFNSFAPNQAQNSQQTPLRQSKSQHRLGIGTQVVTSSFSNNIPQQITQQCQQQQHQQQQQQEYSTTTTQGLTKNQSQLNNLLSVSNNNLNKEEHTYQRSLSQNLYPTGNLNSSNYENNSKNTSQIQQQCPSSSQNNYGSKEAPPISPILASIQNYQIQTQKELMQNSGINSINSPQITTIQNPNQRNNNMNSNIFAQQFQNSQQFNQQKNLKVFSNNSGNSTPVSSNQTLTPKTQQQNKNFTKIKSTRQNLSSTLNQDAFVKQQPQSSSTTSSSNQQNMQIQQQLSGQQNINSSSNAGLLDITVSTNAQNIQSALPSPQSNDCNSQNGFGNWQQQNLQIQNSYSQRPSKVLPSANLFSNTTRSASSDRNLVAQSVQGSSNLNAVDQLSVSNHRPNNIPLQQNSLKYLEGSNHSSQTTPQNHKGNILNRPKDSFFQSVENRQNNGQNTSTNHRRNLTPNLSSNYSSQTTKHSRFTSYTQHVNSQNNHQNNLLVNNMQNQINSAATTPTSSSSILIHQMQQNQIENNNLQYGQGNGEGEQELETSPRIRQADCEKTNFQNNINYRAVNHSKPYSHQQLQQPQSYQETIETMQSQQHFCAQSEENALFSHRNYNFSNIIKTISTNSNNKNQQQNGDKEKKTLNYQSSNKKQTQANSSSKKKKEIYMNNLQSSGKDYKYPEGDNDSKMSLQESMSIMSSCMLVNNEHSLVYEKTLGGNENQEEGNSNPLSDQHQLLTKYSNINLKIKDFSSKKSVLFSKETSQSSSNYIPSKLFEEFFITGPSNGDVQECIRELAQKNLSSKNGSDNKQINTEARVLYHYRNPNSVSSNPTQSYSSQSKIINEFTFPFGCQVKQLKMTNSFSSLNEILFANNSPEQGSSSVSCFVLAFRQDNDSVQNTNLNGNASTQVYQSFPVYYSRVLQLLEKINPSKTLYCVCFKVKDFVESTKLDITTNTNNGTNLQKSYSTSNISKTKMRFWQTEKVFCFVTYFPFIKFFLQTITSILNIIKIKRIKTYNERLDSIPNTLSNIDSDFLTSTFIQISEKILLELANKDLPDFNSSLLLNVQNESIISRIPNAIHACRLETEWGIYKALKQFDINNFLFLFLSLLLEHSLVFVSKNITLLTSTLMLFSNSLIKPLKWVNPMIFNLPQKLIPILHSPVPILVGINKDLSFIQKEKVDQEFNNCLFVQLGNNFKVLNAQIVQDITIEIFNEIKERIEPTFKKIQSHSLKGAPLQEHEEMEIKEDCFALIDTLSSFINNEILSKMPQNPIYSTTQAGLLDYEQITNQTVQAVGRHRTFIKTLFKTQIITYFIEEKYKKQSSPTLPNHQQ